MAERKESPHCSSDPPIRVCEVEDHRADRHRRKVVGRRQGVPLGVAMRRGDPQPWVVDLILLLVSVSVVMPAFKSSHQAPLLLAAFDVKTMNGVEWRHAAYINARKGTGSRQAELTLPITTH